MQSQSKVIDDKVCAGLLGSDLAVSDSGDVNSDTQKTSIVPSDAEPTKRDCSQYKKRSEQLRCEQSERPTCSPSALALEADANLLVEEVGLELQQYGELLTRDLTDVNSRALLCRFSIDELDENYERATQDPETLRSIQRKADGIQQCRGDWEIYIRERAANASTNDGLADDTARDMRAQFEPLIEQLTNLSMSITRLEKAADTIDGLIGIHIDFCPPEGISAEADKPQ